MLHRLQRWFLVLVLLLCRGSGAATAIATPRDSPTDGAQVNTEVGNDPLSPALTAQLDEFVQSQMAAVGIPGVAYAISSPSAILHTGFFGTDGDGAPITPTTAFLWGSLAKPVAATLAMMLVESGELQLDAPVITYLPAFRLRDVAVSDQITVRHLLNQTSGLPTSVALTDHFAADRQAADVLPALADVAAVSAPGTEHHYSSTNYLLLTAVIEAVTGQPFADLLKARVLDPLGMQATITTPAQASRRLAPGHRFVLGQPVAFTTPYDPAGVGYGYLGGTLADAVAFAQANLGSRPAVLSVEQRAVMFQGDVVTSGEHRYGLGWRRWPLREFVPGSADEVIWHGGVAPGYQAMLILLPARAQAIIVLQNVYGVFQEPRLLDTAIGLATLLYGAEPATSQVGVTYPAVLAALVVLGAVLLALVAWSSWRLAHPRPSHRGGRGRWAKLAGWLIALAGLLYGFGIFFPRYLGVGLGQMALWAPDLAGLVWTILGLGVLLVVLRIAVSARPLNDVSMHRR